MAVHEHDHTEDDALSVEEEYPGIDAQLDAMDWSESEEDDDQADDADDEDDDDLDDGDFGDDDDYRDPEEDEEAEPDDVRDESTEGDEGESDRPAVEASALARAKQNLRIKAKASDALLESMDPAAVVEWWESLAPHAAEQDRLWEATRKGKGSTDQAAKAEESANAVPASAEDLELGEHLTADLTPEAAEELKGLLGKIRTEAQATNRDLVRRLAVSEQQAARAGAKDLFTSMLDSGEIVSGLPGNRQKAFERVFDRAVKLAGIQDEEWSHLQGEERDRALILAAARLEGATTRKEADAARRKRVRGARRHGTANVRQNRSTPKEKRKLTEDQQIEAKIAAMDRGVTDVEQLRRIGR